MSIYFNSIPATVRTPGVYVEIDNSRALKGLAANPHRALILGQKAPGSAGGTIPVEVLTAITKENLANGFFGTGSLLARMCNAFKVANPNTELYALALSTAGTARASATLRFSIALSGAPNGSVTSAGTFYLLTNGTPTYLTLESGWSVKDCNSAVQTMINGSTYSHLGVFCSTNATSALNFLAICSGLAGNYMDVRANYYEGQSNPGAFTDSARITGFADGGNADPDLDNGWAVIEGEQFHYIVNPYIATTELVSLEDELEDRFGPFIDIQGHAFTGLRAALASCTTLGNSRNSPHNTIIGAYNSPTDPCIWATALAATAAKNLNNDPARPLQYLELKGVLPPPMTDRFTRAERDVLLYDGIATWIVDSGGRVLIERCVTTYQANALGNPDWSYLDVETLATLGEIRYQFKTRMQNRFIIPRFKLADDDFPIQAGQFIATPKTVKQEIIALFTLLRDKGLIENMDEFVENLIVERDDTDLNRVNCMLPPDMVNQFRCLAGIVSFLL